MNAPPSQRLALIVATFGYVGFFPIAPGTAGSLAGVGLFFALRAVNVPMFELAIIAVVLVAGLWSAHGAERALDRKDPGPVVIDEVLGMLVTLALIPVSWTGVAVGFVLFRILDVVKPYPAGRLERLPGGPGIMLDDAVAGVYANLALRACAWMAPGLLT